MMIIYTDHQQSVNHTDTGTSATSAAAASQMAE
jgi:hypothetical protein